jgi:hypothetical protein
MHWQVEKYEDRSKHDRKMKISLHSPLSAAIVPSDRPGRCRMAPVMLADL